MAGSYVKPLTSMGLRDFDKLGERLNNPSPELVHALVERVQDFLTGFSGESSNEDSIYEIVSELTAAGAWKVIPPADTLHFLELANSATQGFFIKHLPRDYQEALLRETQHAHLMASGARRDAYKAVVKSALSWAKHAPSSKHRHTSVSREIPNPVGISKTFHSISLGDLFDKGHSGLYGGGEISHLPGPIGDKVVFHYDLLPEGRIRHSIHAAMASVNIPRMADITLVESTKDELNLVVIATTLMHVLGTGDRVERSPEQKGKKDKQARLAKATSF